MDLAELDALYRELLSRVSERFELLSAHHGAHVQCGAGCHSCCHPSLTVSEVEARLIRAWLARDPELKGRLLDLERRDPHAGQRCAFLSEEGRCEIYEVRPVVCRSFGVPLLQIEDPEAGEASLSVCELNFTSDEGLSALEGLEPAEWLDTRQTDLALAQLSFHLGQASRADERPQRTPLKPSALTS